MEEDGLLLAIRTSEVDLARLCCLMSTALVDELVIKPVGNIGFPLR